MYRLSLCEDRYELVRLDDPIEAGTFRGEIHRYGDTLLLLHPRADSFIRAEFLISNFRVFPIYMDPGLANVFQYMDEPMVQSLLLDETGKVLRSWEITEDRILVEFRYNAYLDTDTAYHFKSGQKEGAAWEKFESDGQQFIWIGDYENDQRVGTWLLYRLESGYHWVSVVKYKYRNAEVVKKKAIRKPRKLKQIPF
jgi:hypothetical protein